MRTTLIALLVLTSCANAVRDGYYTGDYYRACMKRIGVDESDDDWTEADAVCRKQARKRGSSDALDDMQTDSVTDCVTSKNGTTGDVRTTCKTWE